MKRTTPLRRNGTPCRKHWAAFQKAQGPTLEMRQEMKAKQPRRSLEDMKHGELEALLDAEYSVLVRGSAAIANESTWAKCYTCGAPTHWKSLD
jgi:hypothetical protein